MKQDVSYVAMVLVLTLVCVWPQAALADSSDDLLMFIGPIVAGRCTYSLDKSDLIFDASGGSQLVAVTARRPSCAWTTSVPEAAQNWLTVTANGTGSDSATVTASADTGSGSRSAIIQVAGKDVTISQTCATVSPLTIAILAEGGSQTINVNTQDASCAWTATSNLDWVHIESGGSGTGTGTVTLSIAPNLNTTQRSGTIQVAGSTVTITQEQQGYVCTYEVSPTACLLNCSTYTYDIKAIPSSMACPAPNIVINNSVMEAEQLGLQNNSYYLIQVFGLLLAKDCMHHAIYTYSYNITIGGNNVLVTLKSSRY